jgi:hypothetical protein
LPTCGSPTFSIPIPTSLHKYHLHYYLNIKCYYSYNFCHAHHWLHHAMDLVMHVMTYHVHQQWHKIHANVGKEITNHYFILFIIFNWT